LGCETQQYLLAEPRGEGMTTKKGELIRGSEAFIPFCLASYHCAVLPVSLGEPLVELFFQYRDTNLVVASLLWCAAAVNDSLDYRAVAEPKYLKLMYILPL